MPNEPPAADSFVKSGGVPTRPPSPRSGLARIPVWVWPAAGGGIHLALVAAMLIGTTLTRSTAEDKLQGDPTAQDKLQGVWESVDPDHDDFLSFEFRKGGSFRMTALIPRSGWVTVEGTYKVQGNNLTVRYENVAKGQTETMIIQTLTDMRLVTQDSNGRVCELRRRS
jgi:uncharacterized protein (TIGR03066 family)